MCHAGSTAYGLLLTAYYAKGEDRIAQEAKKPAQGLEPKVSLTFVPGAY